MKAYLVLGNRVVFTGTSIGSEREVISGIMFNMSMTGYLEVLTDPSYARRAVVAAYPLIDNYGICHQDVESAKPWLDDCIVRELSRIPSNFRSEDTIQSFLKERDIPDICSINTRALTKVLKEKGTISSIITTEEYTDFSEPIKRMKEHAVTDVMLKTTTEETCILPGNGKKVVLMDYGAKKNIARSLNQRGCKVAAYPIDTLARGVLAGKPDGTMLSSGLGGPKKDITIIKEVKILCESDVPIFAICLGHQLMTLANGMGAHRLKCGHRGGNRPVKDLETGRVYISPQNHGYVVDTDSPGPSAAIPALVSINNSINEGLKYANENIFTVQHHPEACPRPPDSDYLSDRLFKMIEVNN